MPSVFARRGSRKLYAKLKDVDGKWQQVPTGLDIGQEEAARAWAKARQDEADAARRALAGASGPLTVAAYAAKWLDKRKTATVGDDRNRIEKHALPRIGSLLMTEVRPRHLRDLVLEIKASGELAPKTIREVSGILHTMFNSAVVEEVIAANPVVYERGVLPKKLDKDPSWRRQAIYVRAEVEQLLSDERIPRDRRMLYALKFFTGRHSEVNALTWRAWDRAPKPLGSLALDDTKTGVPRLIPVHATLAKVLAAWHLEGWEARFGRKPEPDDLIVPNKLKRARSASEAQKQLVYDLAKIGLRVKAGKKMNRRGHDLRRTLITLARADGAIDSLLRWVTHGPKPSEILDTYSTPPWEALCREVSKLKISLREGKLVELEVPVAAGDQHGIHGAAVVQSSQPRASSKERKRPQRDSNQRLWIVRDTADQRSRNVAPAVVHRDAAPTVPLHQGLVQPLSTTCDVGLATLRASEPR